MDDNNAPATTSNGQMKDQFAKMILGAISSFIVAKATDRLYDKLAMQRRNKKTEETPE